MSERERVRAFLAENSLTPKKARGQNFLVDGGVLSRIVAAIRPQPGEVLLEIGPGLGTLTRPLLAAGARVVAIEIEPAFIRHLTEDLAGQQLHVVRGDATNHKVLAAAAGILREWAPQAERFRVVGNLPYSVGTAILQNLFLQHALWSEATVLLQHEVVQRLAAKAGDHDRGYMTVLRETFADVEPLFAVGALSFTPRPKVVSGLVRFPFLSQPRIADSDFPAFRDVVNRAFQQKRKKLRNSLREFRQSEQLPSEIQIERDTFAERRPEDLTFAEFKRLFELLRAAE